MITKKLLLIGLSILGMSCTDVQEKTYDELINQGGSDLTSGAYQSALQAFTAARDKTPDRWEPNSGIGWSNFKLDNLTLAASSFSDGSAKAGAGADLYAGWGFVLNAGKDYAGSNAKAKAALDLDSNWTFTYGLGLSASDLHVMKAENYFALGLYTDSKVEVVILNPAFASVDVSTDAGRAELAKEIEIRKGLAKRI